MPLSMLPQLLPLLLLPLVPLASSASVPTDLPSGSGDDGVRLVRMRRATCNEGDCKNGGICWPGTSSMPCLCNEPYYGTYCSVRINYCATGTVNGITVSPCQNGATCTNTDASPWYSCSCVPGFTGTNCEINIDDCASRPCINGLCTDLVNSYSCSCYSGWEGSNCDINHNDCPTNACHNGGRCLDGNGTFTCDCTDTGFTGAGCETNIDDCASRPCTNGLCSDLVKNYSCSCFTGWEGRNCSVDTDYCLPGPCLNGGVCSDGNSTFSCDCSRVDFKGANCSSKIDDCASAPCKHGGRCIDGVRSFTCDCSATDFYGPTCQSRIDDCSPNPCKNNATCVDGLRDYSCSCFSGYSGKNCSDELVDCQPDKCQFNGSCLERSNQALYGNSSLPAPFNGTFSYALAAGFVCICPRGAYGDTCEINPNDCLIPGTNQSVCVHASSCTDGLASFTCHCLPGYEGKNCSVDINECERFGQPCQNGAVCKDLVADYACTNCPAELGGKNCSVLLPSFSFGVGGIASSAIFSSLPVDSSVDNRNWWTIELRLLTLSPGAFLMLLGNLSDSGTTPRLLLMIDSVGGLSAHLLHSSSSLIAAVTSPDSVSTGSFVSAKISISDRELSLSVASAVRAASLSSFSPLPQLSGQLIVGGSNGALAAPAPSLLSDGDRGRAKRSVPALPSSIASFLQSNFTAFRGIISALTLNGDTPLILAPVSSSLISSLPRAVAASDSSAVISGIVGENVCEGISPCKNGATCENIFYNRYSCQCHPGYSGVNCSIDYPDCSPNPCKHGQVCLERSDRENYNLRFLPSPFNGPFRYKLAVGFACINPLGSEITSAGPASDFKSSGFFYATLLMSAILFTAIVGVGVVWLLIRCGHLSCGKFARKASRTSSTPSGAAAVHETVDPAGAYRTANEELLAISLAKGLNQPAAENVMLDELEAAYDTLVDPYPAVSSDVLSSTFQRIAA